jgi:hypothetical protein
MLNVEEKEEKRRRLGRKGYWRERTALLHY